MSFGFVSYFQTNMLDFTYFLPYDVLCLIFSNHRFTKKDLVECRKVCRTWRHHIPEYTKSFWRQVKFSGYDWRYTDSQMSCFLGPHVKKVHIEVFPPSLTSNRFGVPIHTSPNGFKEEQDDSALFWLLKTLVEERCIHIETISFNLSKIYDMRGFLIHLKALSTNLVKLSFTKHRINIPFIATMSVCPSLSHLVFTPYPDNILNEDEPTISPPDDRIPTTIDNDNGIMFHNMLSLSIDSSISYNRRLAAILKRCPNLRILRINNDVIDWRNREGINMDSIFQLCPNVEYVECNNTQSYYRRNIQPSNKIADEIIFKHYSLFGRTTRNSSNHGLRDLIFYESLDSDTMNALLRQINNHNNTLQLLELGLKRDSPISWDGIASIYTPNLRILRLDKIYCSEEAIAVLLSHCPALEELLLHTHPVIEAYDRPFYALRSLKKLKKLTVNYRYGVKSDDDNGLIHHDNVIRGTRGVHQEPSFLVPMRKYLDSVKHTSINAALEEFHIRANNWINLNNDQFLYSVSGLPKLRCLTLVNHTNIDAKSPFITVQGVQEFVQRLHQNTKIEELSLAGIEKLGSKAINNLADLKYLKKLILFGCEHYTGGDLIQLVEQTKSLREITIDDIDLEQCTGLYGAVDYIERQSSLDYGAVMVGPNEVKIEYLGLD